MEEEQFRSIQERISDFVNARISEDDDRRRKEKEERKRREIEQIRKEEELREKERIEEAILKQKMESERLRLKQQKEQFVQSNIENFEYIFDSILENSNIEEALRVGSMIIVETFEFKDE